MSDLPLISVIMPVYQGEAYIAEALDSVFAQGYKPLEVLVIDDGSNDRTPEIAQRYPVRYLRREHEGIAPSRNAGIDAASGDIIAFLDADDLWTPDSLRTRVDHLVANPELDFVLSRMEFFLEPGHERPSWIPERLLHSPQPGLLQTLVARRRVFDTVGRFDEAFETSEDIDWFARAKDAGVPSTLLEDVCARHRLHRESTTHEGRGSVMPALLRALRGSVERRKENAA